MTVFFTKDGSGTHFQGIQGRDGLYTSRDVLDRTGCANVVAREISDAQAAKLSEAIKAEYPHDVELTKTGKVRIFVY